MQTKKIYLWNDTDKKAEERAYMIAYYPEQKISDCALVIFPGGGYAHCSEHSGKKYAEYFSARGITCFSVEYSVFPNVFPAPIADGQRAVQTVRYYAERWGIDREKIIVVGSSAGAHLAATLCTYRQFLAQTDDAIAQENFLPNAQALCYGVLNLACEYAHKNSANNLLGDRVQELAAQLSPDLIADENTPPAFIWHTLEDKIVPVENALEYVKRLKQKGVKAELHIFPDGAHGNGLSMENTKVAAHKRQWLELFITWLSYMHFID